MGKIILGRVRPVYQGAYDETKAYEPLDRVLYNGNVYECVLATTAGTPPSTEDDTYWSLLGVKGETGDKGDKGDKGDQGERGATGAAGSDGAMGATPAHKWDGTKLSFENADGTYDDGVDLQGPQGVKGDQGIQGPAVPLSNSITSTSQTDAASSYAVYQVAQSTPRGNVTIYLDATNGSDTLDVGRGLSASMPFKTWTAAMNYARTHVFPAANGWLYSLPTVFRFASGVYGDSSTPMFFTNTNCQLICDSSASVQLRCSEFVLKYKAIVCIGLPINIYTYTGGISIGQNSCLSGYLYLHIMSTATSGNAVSVYDMSIYRTTFNTDWINLWMSAAGWTGFDVCKNSTVMLNCGGVRIYNYALAKFANIQGNSFFNGNYIGSWNYKATPTNGYVVSQGSTCIGLSTCPGATNPTAYGNSVVNDSRCTLYSGSVCV